MCPEPIQRVVVDVARACPEGCLLKVHKSRPGAIPWQAIQWARLEPKVLQRGLNASPLFACQAERVLAGFVRSLELGSSRLRLRRYGAGWDWRSCASGWRRRQLLRRRGCVQSLQAVCESEPTGASLNPRWRVSPTRFF